VGFQFVRWDGGFSLDGIYFACLLKKLCREETKMSCKGHSKVRSILLLAFIIFSVLSVFLEGKVRAEQEGKNVPGINITDYSFYAAWGMATMHNVTIENPTDVAYKGLKVKIDYYLSYYPTEPYSATVVIPVTLPPNSKNTYFRNGLPSLIVNPNGIYGMHLVAGKIEVLEAVPDSAI
jgi:hypothetical protein